MQDADLLNKSTLFSSKIKAARLKIKGFLSKKHSVNEFISYMELKPLWQKVLFGLVLSLPIFLTGLIIQINILTLIGSCSLVGALILVSLLEFYRQQREHERQGYQAQVNQIEETLDCVEEDMAQFTHDLIHECEVLSKQEEEALARINALHNEKMHLESSIHDLHNKTQVATEIKESLVSENQSLNQIIVEAERLLVQREGEKDSAIVAKETLEAELVRATDETVQLKQEIDQLKQAREALTLRIKNANLKFFKHTIQLYSEDKKNKEALAKLCTSKTSLQSNHDLLKDQNKQLKQEIARLNQAKKELLDSKAKMAVFIKTLECKLKEQSTLLAQSKEWELVLGELKAVDSKMDLMLGCLEKVKNPVDGNEVPLKKTLRILTNTITQLALLRVGDGDQFKELINVLHSLDKEENLNLQQLTQLALKLKQEIGVMSEELGRCFTQYKQALNTREQTIQKMLDESSAHQEDELAPELAQAYRSPS